MNIRIDDLSVPSADGIHHLAGKVYFMGDPANTKPVGIFHIVHGMTEHIARYDRFMREMAEAGWLVCGYDNLGHGFTASAPGYGHTASDVSDLGYIAPKDGYDLLLRDVRGFSEEVRRRYGTELPYVLMGHSMGSFIVRLATERYVRPDRLIVMGTGGPNPVAGVGIALIEIIKKCKGDRYISPFVDRLAFGHYNDRFGGKDADADPVAWLTTDAAVRDQYLADPLCNFKFTVSAMGDLIRLTKYANRPAWFRSLPAGMPVLLVSGTDDPVGHYGEGVLTVRDRLQRAGVPVTCHLYQGARHEILNDYCHEAVVEDILAFLTASPEGIGQTAT